MKIQGLQTTEGGRTNAKAGRLKATWRDEHPRGQVTLKRKQAQAS